MRSSLFESNLLLSYADSSLISEHPNPKIKSTAQKEFQFKENPSTTIISNQKLSNLIKKFDSVQVRNSFDPNDCQTFDQLRLSVLQTLNLTNTSKLDIKQSRASSILFRWTQNNSTSIQNPNFVYKNNTNKRRNLKSVASAIVFKPDFSKKALEDFAQFCFGKLKFRVNELLDALNPYLKRYFDNLPQGWLSVHELIDVLSTESGAVVKTMSVCFDFGKETELSQETKWLLCEFILRYFEENQKNSQMLRETISDKVR